MQSYQYGDTKMELAVPIYMLWLVVLVSFAGTFFCALVTLVAKPAVAAERGRAE
jgi:hypothetical protein